MAMTLLIATIIVAGCVQEETTTTTVPTTIVTTTTMPTTTTTMAETTTTTIMTENNFQLLLSDAQADIEDFDELIVDLSSARVFTMDAENESESGYIEFDINASVDLTQVVGENAISVLQVSLEEGSYSKVELAVSDVRGTVDGSEADVDVPSERLKIVRPFTIISGETTTFVFDIEVVKKGQNQAYNLLPVIAKSGIVGHDVNVTEVECTIDEDCAETEECIENVCTESETCTKTESGETMRWREAKQFAEAASECANLTQTRTCNAETGTWWIDLDIEMEGCAPACVINVVNGSAEVNWRCTGLIE